MESDAPARLLDLVTDHWAAKGWPLKDLATFRMEAGDDDTDKGGDDDKGGDGNGVLDDSGDVDQTVEALKAEVERWKTHSQKHEREWKKFSKELEDIKRSSMSDTEKAVEEAKLAGRAEAMAETSKMLVAAEIRAVLTGVVSAPAEIVEDLDLSKYLTDTGEVDAEKVEKLRNKYEALAKPGKGSGPDLKQGQRGTPSPGQLTRADMAKMTPEAIVKAGEEGRLNEVLGTKST